MIEVTVLTASVDTSGAGAATYNEKDLDVVVETPSVIVTV